MASGVLGSDLPAVVIQEYLTCHVCQKCYVTPRVLPCGHYFCLSCIQGDRQKVNPIREVRWRSCPTCRAIYEVPVGGVAALPIAEFVQSLCSTNSMNTSSEVIGPCDLCAGIEERRDVFCISCDTYICCAGGNEHTSHHVHILPEVDAIHGPEMMTSLTDAHRRHLVEMSKCTDVMREYERSLRSLRREAMKDVRDRADAIRNVLLDLEAAMFDEIEAHYSSERNRAVLQLRHANWIVGNLEIIKNVTGEIKNSGRNFGEWFRFLSLETQKLISSISRKEMFHLRDAPLDISLGETGSVDVMGGLKSLMGEITTGRPMLVPGCTSDDTEPMNSNQESMDYESSEIESYISVSYPSQAGKNKQVLHYDVIRQFSILDDESRHVPCTHDVKCIGEDNIVVTDGDNKCLKFYREDILYRRVHTSCDVRGVSVLHRYNSNKEGNDITFAGLVVCDKTVTLLDTRGMIVRVLRHQPRDCHGIHVNTRGDVIITDITSRSVYVIALETGVIRRIISGYGEERFSSPQYVTCTADDDVIVSDAGNGKLYMLTKEGEVCTSVSEAGDQKLDSPCGVCTDGEGRVILCDTGNHRVLVFNDKLEFLYEIETGGFLIRPKGVTTDSRGRIVVCEEEGQVKILQISDDCKIS